jgi:hypothetical protein
LRKVAGLRHEILETEEGSLGVFGENIAITLIEWRPGVLSVIA